MTCKIVTCLLSFVFVDTHVAVEKKFMIKSDISLIILITLPYSANEKGGCLSALSKPSRPFLFLWCLLYS